MALPLNSYCITKTIYHLANTVNVSLMLAECTGHQTAKKKLTSADRTLGFRWLCMCASSFLFLYFLVTSQGLSSLLLNCHSLSFLCLCHTNIIRKEKQSRKNEEGREEKEEREK